jgi:hypothetical protein
MKPSRQLGHRGEHRGGSVHRGLLCTGHRARRAGRDVMYLMLGVLERRQTGSSAAAARTDGRSPAFDRPAIIWSRRLSSPRSVRFGALTTCRRRRAPPGVPSMACSRAGRRACWFVVENQVSEPSRPGCRLGRKGGATEHRIGSPGRLAFVEKEQRASPTALMPGDRSSARGERSGSRRRPCPGIDGAALARSRCRAPRAVEIASPPSSVPAGIASPRRRVGGLEGGVGG